MGASRRGYLYHEQILFQLNFNLFIHSFLSPSKECFQTPHTTTHRDSVIQPRTYFFYSKITNQYIVFRSSKSVRKTFIKDKNTQVFFRRLFTVYVQIIRSIGGKRRTFPYTLCVVEVVTTFLTLRLLKTFHCGMGPLFAT